MTDIYQQFYQQISKALSSFRASNGCFYLSKFTDDIQSAYANDFLTYPEYESLTEKLMELNNIRQSNFSDETNDTTFVNPKFVEFEEEIKELNSPKNCEKSLTLLRQIQAAYEKGDLSDGDFADLVNSFPQDRDNEVPEDSDTDTDQLFKQIFS